MCTAIIGLFGYFVTSNVQKIKGSAKKDRTLYLEVAPRAGLEPATWWLTATRSTN